MTEPQGGGGLPVTTYEDVIPTCDICGEEWEDGGEGEDWNGDTGNHHSCEARDDARGATLVTACPSCQHLPHVGRCPGYANCGCDTGVSD